jgi:uncharacterized damage-inducible protein DinB
VTDRRPPRVVGDERATLLALLQYQRESVVRKVEGLSEEEARRSPVPSGTSLLWLVAHLARAEAIWVLQRFAGQELEPELAWRDDLEPDDTVAAAIARYRSTWARVDDVIDSSDIDAVCSNVGEGSAPDLRWVLAHLLQETARHAGHADILRELIDGATGR